MARMVLFRVAQQRSNGLTFKVGRRRIAREAKRFLREYRILLYSCVNRNGGRNGVQDLLALIRQVLSERYAGKLLRE